MSSQEISSAIIIANADLRLEANRKAWPAQQEVERRVGAALTAAGVKVRRGHGTDPVNEHGFIDSQRRGIEVFRDLDRKTPVVVALSTWQYTHHILHGLMAHEAPILTVANFDGTWPGLVGLLNLNASLTKAGVEYSTIWSPRFDDVFFESGLLEWVHSSAIRHDDSHVGRFDESRFSQASIETGRQLGRELVRDRAIMGVFDEGCMGMHNAIVPDHLLNVTGIFKERLSQSALFYESMQVSDADASSCRRWLDERGMVFHTGGDEETQLTDNQLSMQLKMYVAALRLADTFGCSTIGIQYQQGLKDLLPASDLAEGLMNNTDRPPVFSENGQRELFAGSALPHFNEADECAGIDALVTHRVWSALGIPPETTLHDVRWGANYGGEFVWVFEISGAAPPAHFVGGYTGASSMRQPPMYFRLGGGTVRGVSKPGIIVWSRVYVEDDRLKCDLGLGEVVDLPAEETERRWRATNYEWPIMHAMLRGVSRDQFMARHKSNHVQVAYADDDSTALSALGAKAAMLEAMGIECWLCGAANYLG